MRRCPKYRRGASACWRWRSANGRLRVGFVDPTDLQAYDEVFAPAQAGYRAAVVTESQLLASIDRVYQRTEEITGLAKELTAELGDMPVEFGDLLGTAPGAEDAPVVKLLQTVFEEALRLRASDIHIEPQETALRIRFRIDGVLHVQTEADAKIAGAVALRLKLMSGLDISEKRLPQDGRFNIKVRNNPVDVRISTMPTQYGESVVMRLLNQSTGLLGLDRLGMPPRVLERCATPSAAPAAWCWSPAPPAAARPPPCTPRCPRSTPPRRRSSPSRTRSNTACPASTRCRCNDKIDLTFERVLRSALRQDPDIVLVGEMRDQVTAEIGMRAAMTGHMVLSTLHTNDAVSTPIRLLDMGVPRYMVALSLQLVLAQRLVRVSASSCAEPHRRRRTSTSGCATNWATPVDASATIKGRGCTHCANTGYQGRTGVYEMLEMTNALVEAANQRRHRRIRAVGPPQMAGETLRRDAVRLVTAGRTTVTKPCASATSSRTEAAHAAFRLQGPQCRRQLSRACWKAPAPRPWPSCCPGAA
jgi:MSHA biogenesis protein MshE